VSVNALASDPSPTGRSVTVRGPGHAAA
jgi:hypothetical protein